MRLARVHLVLAVAAALVAAAPSAQAANRRRVPRAGRGAVRSSLRTDDAVLEIVANTPAGGNALLPAGRFHTALVLDKPIRLVGSPFGTVLDAGDSGRPAITVAQGVEDVTVEGVTLVGGVPASFLAEGGNDRLSLRRVAASGALGDGARIVGGDDVSLDRCTFEVAAGAGLDLGGRRAAVARLAVRAAVGPGVVLRGEDATVSDGTFEGGGAGVVFAGLRDAVVGSRFRGVDVAARMAATADTCTFRRNEVRGARNGIVADLGSTHGLVETNRILSPRGDAVRLLGTWHTVSANVISSPSGAGVVGSGSSLRVADNRLESPTGDGVALVGDGNVVDANAIVAPGGAAVAVEGDGNVLAANACEGAGADAIVARGAANRLVGNTVAGAAAEGIRVAGDANTLQGNDVRDTAGNGLHVAGGAANVLDGNRLSACGGVGFLDEGVGTVLTKNRVD